ncbi:hypothetical protein K505DRAFT_370773 [Melanomma pulvis-pyrius CBS 109.77]|uniref:Uncharacterized protein n=1 Tax=Melanomma pulvis-pyrius CBS 109.77 TaxID=1314802 RepID=A0A6A6XUK9_9PLEO|nr:hypothetical protein K505DRAFT_370773 [Melanomma pulvis-pyrius CBS 109.77]
MSRLNLEPWHEPTCCICGKLVDERKRGFRCISTQPGTTVSTTISTLPVHNANSFPSDYLIHDFCLLIFERACPRFVEHLRYVITTAWLTSPVDAQNFHGLSSLDAGALVSMFGFNSSDRISKKSTDFSKLIDRVFKLPVELYEAIFSNCQHSNALMITACEKPDLFMQLIKRDIVRTRITMCIQAAPLLVSNSSHEVFTENFVKLAQNMEAEFISIAGDEYLRSIRQRSLSPGTVHFNIKNGQPQLLALLVNSLGILNIAFEVDAKGLYKWIRPDIRKHNIVLDIRKFTAIWVVSDPLKCRMISTDLPGHNIAQPRPILPCALRSWAPLPTASDPQDYLQVSGYVEASTINFSNLDKVYLSYDMSLALVGIFTEAGKGRVEVRLEPVATIQDRDGEFLPSAGPLVVEEIKTERCRGLCEDIQGDSSEDILRSIDLYNVASYLEIGIRRQKHNGPLVVIKFSLPLEDCFGFQMDNNTFIRASSVCELCEKHTILGNVQNWKKEEPLRLRLEYWLDPQFDI